MKDNRDVFHDAVDKSSSEQQICNSVAIFFMVRKSWTYSPTVNGSYEGKLADWQAGWEIKCR